MFNIYIVLSIGFGGILFGILLATIWIIFRNFKRRMLPKGGAQALGTFQESYWEEKRKHPRFGIVWPVTIESSNGTTSAKTKDLSLGGAFIVCPKPLSIKEQFRLIINPPDNRSIRLTSEVVWSNINVPDHMIVTRGMGIRFIQNSDSDIESLNAAISGYLEKRG